MSCHRKYRFVSRHFKMTRLFFILILFIGLTISCEQITTKSFTDKKQIDIQTVASIEILKVTGPPDSIKTFWKRLTDEQVKSFVSKWNTTKNEELRKYLPTFKIAVYLKNDSTRDFRASG